MWPQCHGREQSKVGTKGNLKKKKKKENEKTREKEGKNAFSYHILDKKKHISVKIYQSYTSKFKWQAQLQGNFKQHDIGLFYKSENYKQLQTV